MTAFCALLPLASVFVSLSFGGGTTPFVLLQTLVLLPLVKGVSAKLCRFFIPLFLLSVVFRLASLCTLSKGALGSGGALTLAVICAVISAFSAADRETSIRFAPPLFFITALFAVFVTVVSFSSSLRAPFSFPSVSEIFSASVCPVSACLAFDCFANVLPLKRFLASTVGVLLCAVFIIFDAAGAEFAFLSVPLAVLVSSVEIKAILKGIKGVERE